MEGKLQRLDHESLTQSPLRPKSDLVPAEEWDDETVNQEKPDAILEESGDDGQDGKEKSIFSSAEKGKGKMAVDEGEGSDVDESGSSDDDHGSDYSSDGDCTDDPLTEMDVDNIIPGRVRPRIAVKAGTYRLEGESDEDDHTTDGEGEEEEEEEEEEEDEEEGNEEEVENSEGSERKLNIDAHNSLSVAVMVDQYRKIVQTDQYCKIKQTLDFKNHILSLARIKKIMKAYEDMRMITVEVPVVFAHAILELTHRGWAHAEENKRRTLQKNDITAAITRTDIFDFLVDIVPREKGRDKCVLMGTSDHGKSIRDVVDNLRPQSHRSIFDSPDVFILFIGFIKLSVISVGSMASI
ncbi:hypothetical protein M5K25_023801 [Dendrobium thyrsiflorum]|uniref:Transcription factor CBF/NF-Y/archaeal histone domain-containing protein n=1 Tax=Dendrobium thyrsiflorum TaxID=117978 RepID=A0ABD0U0D6_DENTH